MLQHSTVPACSDLAYCRPYPLNTAVPAHISTKQSVAQTDPSKKRKKKSKHTQTYIASRLLLSHLTELSNTAVSILPTQIYLCKSFFLYPK